MRDSGFELKTRARSGIFNCGWLREFVFLRGWDGRLVRVKERDMGFQFQHYFIIKLSPDCFNVRDDIKVLRKKDGYESGIQKSYWGPSLLGGKGSV